MSTQQQQNLQRVSPFSYTQMVNRHNSRQSHTSNPNNNSQRSNNINPNQSIESIKSNNNSVQSTTEFISKVQKEKLLINEHLLTIFPLTSFITAFNYSVSNAIITMLMISYGTPELVDVWIWILPNIFSILIRPYLIRYVHKMSNLNPNRIYGIYNELFVIFVLLILSGIGGLMVGKSCQMSTHVTKKNKNTFMRILVCSIGWILVDFSFQLIEYFITKAKVSISAKCYTQQRVHSAKNERQGSLLNESLQKQKKHQNQDNQHAQKASIKLSQTKSGSKSIVIKQITQTDFKDFTLIGSVLSYCLIILIFYLPYYDIDTKKSFYYQCYLTYTIIGILTVLSAISFYVIVNIIGLPRLDPQIEIKHKQKYKLKQPQFSILSISFNPYYYLPGLLQLKALIKYDIKRSTLLMIHFVMHFMIDIVLIYTTMWMVYVNQEEQLSNSDGAVVVRLKQSEKYFYGIRHGTVYLVIYALLSSNEVFSFDKYLPIYQKTQNNKLKLFKIILLLSFPICIMAFWLNEQISYIFAIMTIALLINYYENVFYESFIQSDNKSSLKTCIQIVDRMQKIFILSTMPTVVMIGLSRDDINDCLLWGGLLCLGMFGLMVAVFKDNQKSNCNYQYSQNSKRSAHSDIINNKSLELEQQNLHRSNIIKKGSTHQYFQKLEKSSLSEKNLSKKVD